MHFMRLFLRLSCAFSFFFSFHAYSEVLTYRFSGYMAEAGDPILVGGSFGSIAPLSSFDGQFSFDTLQLDARPDNGLYGLYRYIDFSISISGQTAFGKPEDGWLAVANASTFDTLNVLAGWSATERLGSVSGTLGGSPLGQIRLDLTDSTNRWFLNDALPTDVNIDKFDIGKIGFHSEGMGLFREGRITSIEKVVVSPVPEPSTYMLFLSGMGLLALSRRRRKN